LSWHAYSSVAHLHGSVALFPCLSTKRLFQLTAASQVRCSTVDGMSAVFLLLGSHSVLATTPTRGPGEFHRSSKLCFRLLPYLASFYLQRVRSLSILYLFPVLTALTGPRWLISQGRTDEARHILANSHASGDENAPLVEYEVIEIETTLQAEKDAHDSTGYIDMIKTKGNRRRLFISISLGVFAQWSGNGVVSYYLSLVLTTVGITSITDQTLISAGLQIWNLIFAVGAAFSVDKLGRRMLFLASALTMLISYIIITGLSASFAKTGTSSVGVTVIPFLFIYFAGYDIAL
jgi:Sugar (and other) transporter